MPVPTSIAAMAPAEAPPMDVIGEEASGTGTRPQHTEVILGLSRRQETRSPASAALKDKVPHIFRLQGHQSPGLSTRALGGVSVRIRPDPPGSIGVSA